MLSRRMIRYVLGLIMILEAVLMIPCVIVGVIYHEGLIPLLVTIALLLVCGGLCSYKKPEKAFLLARDGYVIVGLSWIVLSAFGALPFFLSGTIPNYIDAFFETVSGFTTTGSTILTDVEVVDKCLLFWRSFTHWIGGMGVLVFVLAIVPMSEKGSIHLMRAESPGPSVGKIVPRLKDTAKILYYMYIFLTIIEIICLLIAGMPLYDSIVHTFGTAGTGGFGIYNDSIGHYDSALIDGIITFFLFLFATNFNIFYLIIAKRAKEAFKDEEWHMYLIVFFGAILLVTWNILPLYASVGEALRYSSFQVATIMSTAGYATCNFDLWPEFSKTILFVLMFVGGCAGSTGGGLKVSRILLLIKNAIHEVHTLIRPRSIENVTMNGVIIDKKVRNTANVYFATYFMIFLLSLLVISLDNFDLITNFTGVSACINNVGPGFAVVGPTGNFAGFSYLSKIVLTFDMLVGRLEIFPMLILLFPSTYKKH